MTCQALSTWDFGVCWISYAGSTLIVRSVFAVCFGTPSWVLLGLLCTFLCHLAVMCICVFVAEEKINALLSFLEESLHCHHGSELWMQALWEGSLTNDIVSGRFCWEASSVVMLLVTNLNIPWQRCNYGSQVSWCCITTHDLMTFMDQIWIVSFLEHSDVSMLTHTRKFMIILPCIFPFVSVITFSSLLLQAKETRQQKRGTLLWRNAPVLAVKLDTPGGNTHLDIRLMHHSHETAGHNIPGSQTWCRHTYRHLQAVC